LGLTQTEGTQPFYFACEFELMKQISRRTMGAKDSKSSRPTRMLHAFQIFTKSYSKIS